MSSMPVILQIVPALETGGAERTAIEVSEAVVLAGGTGLVASEGGRLESDLTAAGGELIRFPAATKNPRAIFRNAHALEALIRERNVSLIHARSRAPGWSALMAARRAGVPFVTTYHGIYNQKEPLKGLYNSVMARGDIVIANSHYTAAIVRSRHRIREGTLHVIHRCADLDRFALNAVSPERIKAIRAEWRVQGNMRLVVLAARLTRWKGQLVAINAASKILHKPEFDDVVFVLAGDDQGRTNYRRELESQISAFGLEDRIILPGHCADMPAAFAAAALALVPSIEPEAFGRISVEAQAMGCPVIVSDGGALPETIVTPKDASSLGLVTGWTFTTGDSDELAARVASALSLPVGQRAAMAESAQRFVAAKFSKTTLQRETLCIYDGLLASSLVNEFEGKLRRNEDLKSVMHTIPAGFV
ncbi:MAG: glycosyltransferase family 4 protein [Hyphomicrobiales bacterium]|nr:glycosyltransferase family 4 protein [Hyphomicrobiales bacterium]